jgi:CBS domain-containing protein
MAEQRNAEHRTSGRGSTRTAGSTHLIEKGWTVVDAVGRPIGNVTDVEIDRGVIAVDGRPAGFMPFTVPLELVRTAADGDVHLTKVIDASTSATDEVPKFIDPPKDAPDVASARSSEAERRSETTQRTAQTTATTNRPNLRVAPPASAPVGTAASAPTDPTVAPATGVQQAADRTWKTGRMVAGGLALGGLAAAGYLIRQRMRRKSRWERFLDASSEYGQMTAEFAKQRHPAWWGGLAAAALPALAYAIRSAQPELPPSRTERAAGYLDAKLDHLADWLPYAGAATGATLRDGVRRLQHEANHFELPRGWNRPTSWSPSTEAALSLALVAVSGLAIYLARRNNAPAHTTRIADVMTRRPRTIHPNATVADAAALMRQLDVGALPICDGSRLVGMVTDRDITIRSAADGRDPHLTPVRDIMTSSVAWATEGDPVEEAARIMREHQIRRLPIVDERHSLVGIVSLGDLAVDVNDPKLSGKTLEDISEPSKPER